MAWVCPGPTERLKMDLEFTSGQNIIRNSARRFLQHECPKSKIRELKQGGRGYALELWEKIVELGWPSLAVPEALGGVGFKMAGIAGLVEEVGRHALPSPLVVPPSRDEPPEASILLPPVQKEDQIL